MIASLLLSLAPALPAEPLLQESAGPGAPIYASSSPFSYTYVQGDFVRGDADGFDSGPDGIDLRGSFGFQENLFVFGGLGHVSGDVGGNNDFDVNTFDVGLGYHTPVSPTTDLVVGASLLHADSDTGGPGDTSDGGGWGLQAGVRHLASEQCELDGAIGYEDYSGSSSSTWLQLGAIYRATPQLGLCISLRSSSDIDTLSLGVRYQP
jgi:hypothetical protein